MVVMVPDCFRNLIVTFIVVLVIGGMGWAHALFLETRRTRQILERSEDD